MMFFCSVCVECICFSSDKKEINYVFVVGVGCGNPK